MSDGLDVIIIDDDPGICEIIAELIESFYTWGKVYCFSNPDEAITFCLWRTVKSGFSHQLSILKSDLLE